MFASYQLSDTQKKRIAFYLSQSAALFLCELIQTPVIHKEEDARAMILSHWWSSLCMSRLAQGLSVDINSNALMYRTYWYAFTDGCSASPFMDVASKVCDPDCSLPEDWLDICTEELSHTHTREAIGAVRERILDMTKAPPTELQEESAQPEPEPEAEPQQKAETESLVSHTFAPGESWADRMEMEE